MENEALKTLEATKSQVNDIMKREDSLRRIISDQNISLLKKSLELMVGQLERVINEEKVSPTEEEISLVRDVTRIFANLAIEKPIEPVFRDLSASLLLLIHNWNLATVNNPDIEAHVKLTDGVVRAQLTLMDTLFVVQKVLERLRRMQEYEPPAFNLSRAYLENLKKAIEEKGSDALVADKQKRPAEQEKNTPK